MAYGRKDYFWGVAPDKSVFGELQTPWVYYGTNTIPGDTISEILIYDVSTGYNLQVTALYFGATIPGVMWVRVEIDAVVKLAFYFDTELTMPLGEGGNLLVKGGERLTVDFYNKEPIEGIFTAHGFGFLQQTVV